MTFGSLFAGIGGFDLGFERAGMRCVWQVEIDEYCRRVLTKHWPDVPKWDDVRTFTGEGFEKADVICGGFPCQDISEANAHGRGLEGERSGLWFEFYRVLRLLRPRYAIIENVAAITFRGLGTVLGNLAEIGFDAEWSVVSACSMGAPHMRERVFIVAYATAPERRPIFSKGRNVARSELLHGGRRETAGWCGIPHEACGWPWTVEPGLYGVAHGIPHRVDRINGTGNSVSPIVAEWIGRRLMTAPAARPTTPGGN